MAKKTNLGGRPPLPPEEVRSEIFRFALTGAEKKALRKTAEIWKYDSISDFVRHWIMDLVQATTEGASVEEILTTIGKTSTSGAHMIPDADLPPGEFVWQPWETDEVK